MAPARLWLTIFLAGFAVCTGLLVATLLTPASYGDLSRVGRISEREFGWHTEPPKVDAKWLRGVPLPQAEVLVIGDSFSASYRWQSVLVRAGYGVASTTWAGIDEKLCDDFDDWLARSGFRGRLVIVESVERLLAWRLNMSADCRHMEKPLEVQTEPPTPPLERVPGFALNWNGQLVSGWLTQRCTSAAIAGKTRSGCDRQTRALPVADGCTLFSHRRCDMALFLRADKDHGELLPSHAERMQSFARASPKVPILWMTVPNKTTVYAEPAHSRDFAAALARDGLGPDLFAFAQAQKTRMRDFYLPNDTHISMEGQLVLGERMLQEVQQRIGAPAARGSSASGE